MSLAENPSADEVTGRPADNPIFRQEELREIRSRYHSRCRELHLKVLNLQTLPGFRLLMNRLDVHLLLSNIHLIVPEADSSADIHALQLADPERRNH